MRFARTVVICVTQSISNRVQYCFEASALDVGNRQQATDNRRNIKKISTTSPCINSNNTVRANILNNGRLWRTRLGVRRLSCPASLDSDSREIQTVGGKYVSMQCFGSHQLHTVVLTLQDTVTFIFLPQNASPQQNEARDLYRKCWRPRTVRRTPNPRTQQCSLRPGGF